MVFFKSEAEKFPSGELLKSAYGPNVLCSLSSNSALEDPNVRKFVNLPAYGLWFATSALFSSIISELTASILIEMLNMNTLLNSY